MSRYDPRRDLRILKAMTGQVERYLIEEELFWPISGRVQGGMPRLTIGGLLFRRHRLLALRGMLTARQATTLDEALATFDAARSEWAIHYNQKIAREWDFRVQLVQAYLQDCEASGERARTAARAAARECFDYWPSQAEQRTILQHLRDEAAARATLTDAQQDTLRRLDGGLRRYLLSGESGAFLWASELAPIYPRQTYWWLWVMPYEDLDEDA